METAAAIAKKNPEKTRPQVSDDQVSILRFQSLEEADAIPLVRRGKMIVDLHGNLFRSFYDMLRVCDFSGLRKLDLSNNKVDELPDAFQLLPALQILYLHQNQIVDWSNLERLKSLPRILHITLFSNPIVNRPGYRHYVVNSLPTLIALDLHVITDEERCDDIAKRPRFRTLSTGMSFRMPSGMASLTNPVLQTQELNRHIQVLRRQYEKNCPSVLIQRNFRGFLQRCKFQNLVAVRGHAASRIGAVFRGWVERKAMCYRLPWSFLKHHLFALPGRHKALALIRMYLQRYSDFEREERRQCEAANRIKRFFRMLVNGKKDYIAALRLEEVPVAYFMKDQRKLLETRMAETLTEQEVAQIKVQETQDKYETIRVADPEDLRWSPLPLVVVHRLCAGMKLKRRASEQTFLSVNPERSVYSFCGKDPAVEKIFRVVQLKFTGAKQIKRLRDAAINRKQKRVVDAYSDLGAIYSPDPALLVRFVSHTFESNCRAAKSGGETLGLYFEPILARVAAAVGIQAWYRSRKIVKRECLLQSVANTRAAIFVQRWTRWNALRMRLRLLSDVRQHCGRIEGSILLLEEGLYLRLQHLSEERGKKKAAIMEQHVKFGFVRNKVLAWYNLDDHKALQRYSNGPGKIVCPNWMDVSFPAVNHDACSATEDLMGLLHSTFAPAELKSYLQLVDSRYKGLDVTPSLSFVKIVCDSKEEARRRAYLMAIKTFSPRTQEYVRMYTPEMLQSPVNCAQHLKTWKAFGVDRGGIQIEPAHPEDAAKEESNPWPSIISRAPVVLLDLDCVRLQQSEVYSNVFGHVGTAENEVVDVNDVYDNEKELAELRAKQLQEEKTEQQNKKTLYHELLKYRARFVKREKKQLEEIKRQQQESYIEDMQSQVQNVRQMQRSVKSQHKEIYDKQLDAFHKILREERATIKTIIEKGREENLRGKAELRGYVQKLDESRRRKKDDRAFCVGFMQIQNLINKQLKITDHQKLNNASMIEKRERMREIKRKIATRSARPDAVIKIKNLDALNQSATGAFEENIQSVPPQSKGKGSVSVFRRYDVYLKRKQLDGARMNKSMVAGTGRSEAAGGLQRIQAKKGRAKPAIFREELYPIVHKAANDEDVQE